jgi:hypothetical protein
LKSDNFDQHPLVPFQAGGVGLSRKPGDQTNSLLFMRDPSFALNIFFQMVEALPYRGYI